MAPKKQQRARKKAGRARMGRRMVARPQGDGKVGKLLNLITDPCGAELTSGYGMTTHGLVQRFNRFITPVATTETAFAYLFNPTSQQNNTAIYQKLAVGTATPTTIGSGGPGELFLEANADVVAPLAACIQVLYTGKLVDRKGYIGVCQVSARAGIDIAVGNTDLPTLLSYCQQVSPVPSHTVELKWSPSVRNFTAQNGIAENDASWADNMLMVVAVGVNPSDFVVKFTGVYEYVPKFTLGQPAPRATMTIPPNVGPQIVSTLDRMGVWWHNLGDAAGAAFRLGASASYGLGQVARTARAYGSAAAQIGRAAVPLLALAG